MIMQRPPAPSNVRFTGIDTAIDHYVISLSMNDPAQLVTFYEIWELLPNGTHEIRGVAEDRPSVLKVFRGHFTQAQPCVVVRAGGEGGLGYGAPLIEAQGTSIFSKPACFSGASMPPPAGMGILGLGNGVSLCHTDLSACGIFPQFNQPFKVAWQLCNMGTASSPSGTVTLITTRNGTREDLPMSAAALSPGACTTMTSPNITVSSPGVQYFWDVYFNTTFLGGQSWTF
jgi:hypothetical protein